MSELQILLIEIFIILSLYIFVFIYSVISVDTITTLLSFLIFLILLIPFYFLLEKLDFLVHFNNLEDIPIFNLIVFYSTLINLFIGLYLFVELVYLFFYG
ncbi:hypothetical protein LCGC14_1505720 [marine sediment metagenome]|uniref:Uncharacterized protein n=1 Tax=marine sediment metagenome TaxID=412755 RepID=A0A0F9J2T2_9ZZZZ